MVAEIFSSLCYCCTLCYCVYFFSNIRKRRAHGGGGSERHDDDERPVRTEMVVVEVER